MTDFNNKNNELQFGPALANNFSAAEDSSIGNVHNPSNSRVPSNFDTDTFIKLNPVCPDPDAGYQTLSDYLVNELSERTILYLSNLCTARHVSLDKKYWKRYTRRILETEAADKALVISSPAGSGKSTWMLSFLLALMDVMKEHPELDRSLVGVVVVLQKVEDLNALADRLNKDCTSEQPAMVSLQGWTDSGWRRGLCCNPSVDNYEACLRQQCPYAEKCPILRFPEAAKTAPIVGMTQERFYQLREQGLDSVLYRQCPDGQEHPRRYILFDEKFQMASVTAVSADTINEASSAFSALIQKLDLPDQRVCGLQQRLDRTVRRLFQQLRYELRRDTDDGSEDILVGVLSLTEDMKREYGDYLQFRDFMAQRGKRYLNRPLADILLVLDHLFQGGQCLFTKTEGFTIYYIQPPRIQFGNSLSIIFDATAQVDEDYQPVQQLSTFLNDAPERTKRSVELTRYNHDAFNVSKSAMNSAWKLPLLVQKISKIISSTNENDKVFVCTYKDYSAVLAKELKAVMPPDEYQKILLMADRGEDTLPYSNGVNGSNAFQEATHVILVGYPRLPLSAYLALACAAYGMSAIATELETCLSQKDKVTQNDLWQLPSVQKYMAHHLAARMEQDIYRCAQRRPDFQGEIHVHLFYPPRFACQLLIKRLPGVTLIDENQEPANLLQLKRRYRSYQGGTTSYGRLETFLSEWDGEEISVIQLREQLGISAAVWKDLMKDNDIKTLMKRYGVVPVGRGANRKWTQARDLCA